MVDQLTPVLTANWADERAWSYATTSAAAATRDCARPSA